VDVADLADTWGAARSGGRKHLGIDIMAPKGRPVRAAAHGEIVRLATTTLGGTAVYQRDATGDLILYYAHLDRYAPGLKEGALVDQGEVIGYVGATGNATVPHLHFEITRQPDAKRWSGGRPVNPYPVLKTGALAPPAQAANSGSTPGGR
jgi:murein DD-endopeptidase MepM/ murein hydrolase activator NlpD